MKSLPAERLISVSQGVFGPVPQEEKQGVGFQRGGRYGAVSCEKAGKELLLHRNGVP